MNCKRGQQRPGENFHYAIEEDLGCCMFSVKKLLEGEPWVSEVDTNGLLPYSTGQPKKPRKRFSLEVLVQANHLVLHNHPGKKRDC